jgi:hypothetical protein
LGGTRTNNFDSLTQGLITKVYGSNKKLKKNENSFFERLHEKKKQKMSKIKSRVI